jgi:hypothetical protein
MNRPTDSHQTATLSRRSFLRKAGCGTAAAAVASPVPNRLKAADTTGGFLLFVESQTGGWQRPPI